MTAKHMLIDLYDPFKRGHTSDNPIKWECVQTFRKLTLVSATTFIVHPIGKLYMVLGLLSVFFLHHLHVRPYADDRYVYFGGGFSRAAHSAIPPLTDFRFRIPLRLKTIKDVHSVSAYNFWTVHSVFPPQKIGLYSGLFRHSANLETPQIGFKNYRGCVSHPLFGTVTPYKHCVPFHRVFCTIGVHCMVQLSPSDQNFCCRESFDGEALRRWHHYGEIISRIYKFNIIKKIKCTLSHHHNLFKKAASSEVRFIW